MSTNKTEKSDDTATTSNDTTEQKANDNKKVFGPLGKYAIAAVIMVSIIVTTAIMLNKQLGTVDEQLAAIESEVAELNTVDSDTIITVDNSESTTLNTAVKSESDETQAAVEVAEVEVSPVEVVAVQTTEVPAADAKVLVAIETTNTVTTAEEKTSDTNQNTEQVSTAAQTTTVEPSKAENTSLSRHSQRVSDNDQKWEARIQANKLEKKQRMTEMFARIKALESQQLDQYKVHQDKQIERLREQIARQQTLIEDLILRNKERLEMREASVQRHQTKREQILNRI